jgi:hypothetical protein
MNCFLDRLLETKGKVVAQKTYEEIKKNPKAYSITEDTSGGDACLGTSRIPILFFVDLGATIKA